MRIVGYAAINLFVNRYSGKQPDDDTDPVYILKLNISLGSLLEFWSLLVANSLLRTLSHKTIQYGKIVFLYYFLINQIRMQLERLPCASLLVRINMAALSEDGLRVLSIKDFKNKSP